jgi:dihydrofolate synthase/folylpolyglutamate synthase
LKKEFYSVPTVRNFAEANNLLRGLYEKYKTGVAQDFYTLDTMRQLMEVLGNPQNRCRVLHVAGTSGKSSTSYYLAALLRATGASVGLCTSPHILEVNERVQINLEPLAEEPFCKGLSEFWDIATGTGLRPSYFEMLVAFAYWEFDRRHLDYVVMEVGVGGLLDGTNVVDNENKVCIITDIGLDHTKLLGSTIPEIAAQKAGIIQPHTDVFMYEQGKDVMEVVQQRCALQQARLHTVQTSDAFAGYGLPLFQQRNLRLAQEVVAYVLQRDGRPPLAPRQLQSASQVLVPGRMETFHIGEKILIIDGAHNEQKMTALTSSITAAYPDQPVAVLLSVVHGQDERWRKSLGVLLPSVSSCIVTSFHQEADDRIKSSVAAEDIAAYVRSISDTSLQVEPDVEKAFTLLQQSKEPILLVTGSLYLLGDVLRLLGGAKPELPTPAS